VLTLHQPSLQLFRPLELSKSSAGSSVTTLQITTPILKPLVLSSSSITSSAGSDVLVMLSTLLLDLCFLAKNQKLLRRSLLNLMTLNFGGSVAALVRSITLSHRFVPHLNDVSNSGTTKSTTPLSMRELVKRSQIHLSLSQTTTHGGTPSFTCFEEQYNRRIRLQTLSKKSIANGWYYC
jgi:hypothetical protein